MKLSNFTNFRVSNANSSQQQDPNRGPSGGPIPPNGSGTDMQSSHGGPLTPLQQGNVSGTNLNVPNFRGEGNDT